MYIFRKTLKFYFCIPISPPLTKAKQNNFYIHYLDKKKKIYFMRLYYAFCSFKRVNWALGYANFAK